MDPIAYTAEIVAAKRAIEQTLPQPLGQDPLRRDPSTGSRPGKPWVS
ncbi:MAG: hypothetical protein LVS60_03695 [Nodosilinea sp. LVE1205-7]|jgi:O-methyltransferase involved in polyketide biosynthesis